MREDPSSIPIGTQFSIPAVTKFVPRSGGRQVLWSWLRTPTLMVRVQLLLGWHTYLLFKSDVKNFVWKTDEGRQEALFC